MLRISFQTSEQFCWNGVTGMIMILGRVMAALHSGARAPCASAQGCTCGRHTGPARGDAWSNHVLSEDTAMSAPLPFAQRYGTIVAAIATVACCDIAMGLTLQLLPLLMEQRSVPAWIMGLNAAMAPLGILLAGPFLPRIVARVGSKTRRLYQSIVADHRDARLPSSCFRASGPGSPSASSSALRPAPCSRSARPGF